jgi:hypothetical protein
MMRIPKKVRELGLENIRALRRRFDNHDFSDAPPLPDDWDADVIAIRQRVKENTREIHDLQHPVFHKSFLAEGDR